MDIFIRRVNSLASNEFVPQNNLPFDITKGAAVADGAWYLVQINEFMQDNISVNANTVSFSYALETNAGVIEANTTTLPVL